MAMHIRGALVEYSGTVLGPLPNVVVFQFNPEQLTRNLNIPQRTTPAQATTRTQEPRQTSSPPSETFNLTAHFSVADELGEGGAFGALARTFGVGPQLAALEKMAYPPGGFVSGSSTASVDQVGDAVAAAISVATSSASQVVPRESLPKVLFIWGPSRVLPVEITSLSITEQKYDFLLNPVQAQIEIGLGVVSYPASRGVLPSDPIGVGALAYTQAIKDAQAVVNLTKIAELVPDIISF